MHLQGVNSMAMSGLVYRKPLVGSRWATSLLLCMNGLRKQTFHLVGPPLLVLKVVLQSGHSGTARMTESPGQRVLPLPLGVDHVIVCVLSDDIYKTEMLTWVFPHRCDHCNN